MSIIIRNTDPKSLPKQKKKDKENETWQYIIEPDPIHLDPCLKCFVSGLDIPLLQIVIDLLEHAYIT
jgi:hypothetical protein